MTADLDVSRETQQRLEAYIALLKRWNTAINLVSRATLEHIWTRHVADSAQLFALGKADASRWVDLGSGGGFPGLVIAIIAAEAKPAMEVILVESDARKATFLREAARVADVDPQIVCGRAESVRPLCADIVSARALAPLPKLLPLCERHMVVDGQALLPKGRGFESEMQQALEHWRFSVQKHSSRTDPDGVILSLQGVRRA